MPRLRLPSLSLIDTLRRPGSFPRDWRVGQTYDGNELLLLATPEWPHRDEPCLRFGNETSTPEHCLGSFQWDEESQRFSAKLHDASELPVEVLPNWCAAGNPAADEHPEIRSRAISAMGIASWLALTNLKVGIVGAGGLGANLASQLVADGVRNLVIADPDNYELSNIGRLPPGGFGEEIVGLPKPDVLAQKLREQEPGVQISTLHEPFETWTSFKSFLNCDLIVVACDSALTRRAVARYTARYLIPAISIGTGVFAASGTPTKIWEGAAWLPGGEGCLACLLGLDRATAMASDLHQEVGVERLGSLRSLNLEAVAWAMRTIEEIASATLLGSASIRGSWIRGRLVMSSVARRGLSDCACQLVGVGDRGL